MPTFLFSPIFSSLNEKKEYWDLFERNFSTFIYNTKMFAKSSDIFFGVSNHSQSDFNANDWILNAGIFNVGRKPFMWWLCKMTIRSSSSTVQSTIEGGEREEELLSFKDFWQPFTKTSLSLAKTLLVICPRVYYTPISSIALYTVLCGLKGLVNIADNIRKPASLEGQNFQDNARNHLRVIYFFRY